MAPKVKVKILVAQSCQILCDSWTVAHQAPLSIEFSRQEYWSGLPFPSSGDLPDPGIEARSPALQVDSLPSEPPGKSQALSKKNVAWWMYWWLTLASHAAPKAGSRDHPHPRQRDWGAPERSGYWEGCGSHTVWEHTGMSHVFGLKSTLGCLPWSCSP